MSPSANPRFTRAALLHTLAEPFVARGGDIGEILRRNRISLEALHDPNLLVEASACYAAMEDMATALDDPYFGATVARAAAIRGVASLSVSASRAKTLGDFLIGAVTETSRQFDNVAYSLRVTPDAAVFAIRRTRHVKRPTIQADAIGVVFYTTIVSACVGDAFDAGRMRIAARSFDGLPPGTLPARALVRSREIALSLTFPTDWLQAPFRLAWSVQRPQYDKSVCPPHTQVLLSYLRATIRDNLAVEGFDLTRLATLCDVTPRRLQRLLAAQGTSFRSIRDEVRREVAIGLVTGTKTALNEVAARTGFSGDAAFCRSYRRWTGDSPASHRAAATRER